MADGIELQPLDVAHVAPLRELHQYPGVLRWWGPMDPEFPFDEPDSQRFAIVVGGQVAGLVQWGDDSWEENRHAYIDIFLGDAFAGHGIGTEVVRRVIRDLTEERGYHRITIDPAPENSAAVRCYEKAGFRTVGRLERASLEPHSGEWRDELFMELVVPQPARNEIPHRGDE
jgi:aminoglycoside 6'-N-acetyltransferase